MSSIVTLQTAPGGRRSLPVAAPTVPPFALVALHFGAAFGWLLLATVGLVWLAPTLAAGTFLDPRVLALTHTLTLGFLTTVIMGVLYQIYPALLGAACRSLGVAWWSLAAQTVGTALLVTGLLSGVRVLLAAGWSVLFLATFGVAWNVLPGRRRAVRNRQVGAYVSYAHTAFGFAMAIGLARIGDGFGWWTTPRLALLAAHFQFGAIGFGGLTAMGVGSRMIPMFLGVEQRECWELRWIPRVILTGAVVFALGAFSAQPLIRWVGAFGMVAGGLLFLRLARRWFDRSPLTGRDATIVLLGSSFAALAAAIPLGLAALAAGPGQPRTQAAYPVLVLLGWLGALILGVSYRILPNLTWHHRFASRTRNPAVPGLASLLSPRLSLAAAWLYSAGLLLLIPALLFGHGGAARIGAGLICAAVVGTIVHHLRLGTRAPRAGGVDPVQGPA